MEITDDRLNYGKAIARKHYLSLYSRSPDDVMQSISMAILLTADKAANSQISTVIRSQLDSLSKELGYNRRVTLYGQRQSASEHPLGEIETEDTPHYGKERQSGAVFQWERPQLTRKKDKPHKKRLPPEERRAQLFKDFKEGKIGHGRWETKKWLTKSNPLKKS